MFVLPEDSGHWPAVTTRIGGDTLGWIEFEHVEAPGDLVMQEFSRELSAAWSPDGGEPRPRKLLLRLMAGCVLGWDVLRSADGPPVEWPAAGRAMEGVPSADPCATDEEIDARCALLRRLPPLYLAELERSVCRLYLAGVRSGKGSRRTSNGT